MPPTLAQSRGYLIRDIKTLIKQLNLSLVKINPDKVKLETQLSKIEAIYSQFAQIDETFIQSLESEETALKQAEAQAEEVYLIFLEASKGVKSVIEKPSCTNEPADDSRFFQNARLHQPVVPKPTVFTGNSDDFLTWSADFDDATKHLFIGEKFQLLKRCTGGRAREAIQPFLFGEHSESNFSNAFSCLKDRFGDDDLIADHYLQRLENWEKITSGVSLQVFVDFLRIVLALHNRLPALEIINSKLFNKKLMAKLPRELQDKWIEFFVDKESSDSCFPTFSIFVEFLERKAKVANHSHRQNAAHATN